MDVVDAWISCSKATLNRLYLHRQFFSLPQVQHLALAFPRLYINLTALHLEVHVLCPAIFDILSRNVLTLLSINLVYQVVGGIYISSRGDEHEHSPHAVDVDSREASTKDCPFVCAMTEGRYGEWGLCDIGIWEYQVKQPRYSYHINDFRYMAAVARAAPRKTTLRRRAVYLADVFQE
ncbi:hypothetical protein BDN71DRAFT_1449998 [Pleurotus eryngii]|uniref:Uncharacterized protein n=1 Tax=Pleurotus eryngii TaxID=5323 RepID=A0A9P6D5K6_PLEER|nr:hypothetical protein BDN71DRAFT_1449998 [Pleurotus eryngii]